jgi:hypothetical protein
MLFLSFMMMLVSVLQIYKEEEKEEKNEAVSAHQKENEEVLCSNRIVVVGRSSWLKAALPRQGGCDSRRDKECG